MTSEEERFERELADLRAEYKDVSIMGKHTFKCLTLITEDKEYQPREEENDEQG